MDAIAQRLQVLERRFERSRRINRFLILAALATACLAGAQGNTPVASQAKPQPLPSSEGSPDDREQAPLRRVEAREFVLVDEAGRPRATMNVDGNQTAITLLDVGGRKRLELSQSGGASGLRLFNSDQSPVVSLALPSDAEPACLEIASNETTAQMKADGLRVFDASKNSRVNLTLLNGNFPVLGLNTAGQNGPPSVELTAPEGSRSLKLHDESGHPTFSIHVDDSGRTALNLSHRSHERSLQIKSGPGSVDGPAIEFFAPANEDGTGGLLPHLRLGLDDERRPFVRIVDGEGQPVFAAP